MAKVYYSPIEKIESPGLAAKKLFEKMIREEKVELEPDLLLKIHPGAIGNTAYVRPDNYTELIEFLKTKTNVSYVETCMEASLSAGKLEEFKQHGFDQINVVIADGKNGNEHVEVPVKEGKHFENALIAKRLAEAKQVIVASHFKGHCMSGFGGAIKMLGIGFASGQGKTVVHGLKSHFSSGDYVDWDNAKHEGESKKWVANWNPEVVSEGVNFRERVAEYAQAAIANTQLFFVTFAINIVNNCDCDGKDMKPVYKDLGVFASTDPVAVDKAVFDLLEKREGEAPFEGEDIFAYAERIGLGSTDFSLETVD